MLLFNVLILCNDFSKLICIIGIGPRIKPYIQPYFTRKFLVRVRNIPMCSCYSPFQYVNSTASQVTPKHFDKS